MPSARFYRYGRTAQLAIDSAADLAAVLELDEALWVATSAHLQTLNGDARFLDYLDGDGDGAIRADEVKAAIRWLLDHLRDLGGIDCGDPQLDRRAVNGAAVQGPAILEAADRVLQQSHDLDGRVALQDVREFIAKVEAGELGRPGAVLPAAAQDEAVRAFMQDIAASAADGGAGVDEASLQRFLERARAVLDWRAARPAGDDLGEAAPREIYELTQALGDKLDQYFALCDLAHLNPALAEQASFNALPENLDASDYAALCEALRKAPLAQANRRAELDFTAELNPYYAQPLARLHEQLQSLGRLAGTALGKAQWLQLKQALAPYRQWLAAEPEGEVANLDSATLRSYLQDPFYTDTVRALVETSRAQAVPPDGLRALEKLILFQAHMLRFVNSYVSFPDLYDPASRAMFEQGTLIMDGRRFTLCVKAPDLDRHAAVSALSHIFTLYAEISPQQGEPIYTVAVPVTSGGRGNLQINKRGVFHDSHGREYHARIVRIVENPISLYEAILAPFQSLARTVTAKLKELSSRAHEKLAAASTATSEQVQNAAAARSAGPADGIAQGGVLAGGGIAIAALGSSLAFITKTLASLNWLNILGGLLVVVLIVLIPTALSAYIKLRRRDLSAILEGSGWAINARMRLTWRQAHNFTFRPRLPGAVVQNRRDRGRKNH